jgi:hypothetical protein
MKRVTFYLDDKEYHQLKIVLAVHGMSASEWLRHEISSYVQDSTSEIPIEMLAKVPKRAHTPTLPLIPTGFDENIDLN